MSFIEITLRRVHKYEYPKQSKIEVFFEEGKFLSKLRDLGVYLEIQ